MLLPMCTSCCGLNLCPDVARSFMQPLFDPFPTFLSRNRGSLCVWPCLRVVLKCLCSPCHLSHFSVCLCCFFMPFISSSYLKLIFSEMQNACLVWIFFRIKSECGWLDKNNILYLQSTLFWWYFPDMHQNATCSYQKLVLDNQFKFWLQLVIKQDDLIGVSMFCILL